MCIVTNNLCCKEAHTCLGHNGGTGGERTSGILEDKLINNHINEKFSSRALH